MGLYFVCGQGYEYLDLIRKQHVTCRTSNYGSVFYLTTGFHGLHVTGGLIAFLFLLGRTFAAKQVHPRTAGQRHRRVVLLAFRRRRLDRPVHDHLPDPLSRKLGTAVSWITAQAAAPAASYAVVLLGLVLVGAVYATITASGESAAATPSAPSVGCRSPRARQIFLQDVRQLPRPRGAGHRGRARA